MIYCEYFETKEEAIKREKELKNAKGREWIRQNIKVSALDLYPPETDGSSSLLHAKSKQLI